MKHRKRDRETRGIERVEGIAPPQPATGGIETTVHINLNPRLMHLRRNNRAACEAATGRQANHVTDVTKVDCPVCLNLPRRSTDPQFKTVMDWTEEGAREVGEQSLGAKSGMAMDGTTRFHPGGQPIPEAIFLITTDGEWPISAIPAVGPFEQLVANEVKRRRGHGNDAAYLARRIRIWHLPVPRQELQEFEIVTPNPEVKLQPKGGW